MKAMVLNTGEKLSPAWLWRLAKKYPWTVGLVVVALVIAPFSPVTFSLLHGITWLFSIK